MTRDGVRAEGIPGGYGAVYGELKDLETIGACRRGYFVEGLGGAQFALAGGVERLRELRSAEEDEPEPLVLAAADPAQPYGAALPWPKRAGSRAARVAGAQVVLLGGEAALFVERGGRTLVPLREPDEAWLRPAIEALVAARAPRRRQAARRRALRRPAGRRDGDHAAARRSRVPRGTPPRRPATVKPPPPRADRGAWLRVFAQRVGVRPFDLSPHQRRMLVGARAASVCFVIQGTLAVAGSHGGR